MIFLAVYYLVAVVLVLVLCAALYVSLSRFGRARYVAIPVFFLVCVLLIPIPIHAGFMIFAEVVIDGIEEFLEDRREMVEEQRRSDWRARFKERLPQAVSIDSQVRLNPSWNQVTLTDGTEAWLDVREGLVWTDVLLGSKGNDDRAQLIDACRQAGAFTLALEIEMFYFYEHRGPAVMPFADFRYPSLLVEDGSQLELVKWRNFQAHGNQQRSSPGIAVRCVGRTSEVPAEGLVDRQISAADWNRFQTAPIR